MASSEPPFQLSPTGQAASTSGILSPITRSGERPRALNKLHSKATSGQSSLERPEEILQNIRAIFGLAAAGENERLSPIEYDWVDRKIKDQPTQLQEVAWQLYVSRYKDEYFVDRSNDDKTGDEAPSKDAPVMLSSMTNPYPSKWEISLMQSLADSQRIVFDRNEKIRQKDLDIASRRESLIKLTDRFDVYSSIVSRKDDMIEELREEINDYRKLLEDRQGKDSAHSTRGLSQGKKDDLQHAEDQYNSDEKGVEYSNLGEDVKDLTTEDNRLIHEEKNDEIEITIEEWLSSKKRCNIGSPPTKQQVTNKKLASLDHLQKKSAADILKMFTNTLRSCTSKQFRQIGLILEEAVGEDTDELTIQELEQLLKAPKQDTVQSIGNVCAASNKKHLDCNYAGQVGSAAFPQQNLAEPSPNSVSESENISEPDYMSRWTLPKPRQLVLGHHLYPWKLYPHRNSDGQPIHKSSRSQCAMRLCHLDGEGQTKRQTILIGSPHYHPADYDAQVRFKVAPDGCIEFRFRIAIEKSTNMTIPDLQKSHSGGNVNIAIRFDIGKPTKDGDQIADFRYTRFDSISKESPHYYRILDFGASRPEDRQNLGVFEFTSYGFGSLKENGEEVGSIDVDLFSGLQAGVEHFLKVLLTGKGKFTQFFYMSVHPSIREGENMWINLLDHHINGSSNQT